VLRASLPELASVLAGPRASPLALAPALDGLLALGVTPVLDVAPWPLPAVGPVLVRAAAQAVRQVQAPAPSAVPLRPWAASRDGPLQAELRQAPGVLRVLQDGPVVWQDVQPVPLASAVLALPVRLALVVPVRLPRAAQCVPVQLAAALPALRSVVPAARVACPRHMRE
jgi:hypothetical protein